MGRLSPTIITDTLNTWYRNQPFPTRSAPMALSLHTGDPGVTGASEVSGLGYARQPVTFNVPNMIITIPPNPITFSNLPACTIVGVGTWSGTEYIQGGLLFSPQPVQAGGSFALDSLQFGFGF